MQNLQEALKGLQHFNDNRLSATEKEKKLIKEALEQAEIELWQITALIEALQGKSE